MQKLLIHYDVGKKWPTLGRGKCAFLGSTRPIRTENAKKKLYMDPMSGYRSEAAGLTV